MDLQAKESLGVPTQVSQSLQSEATKPFGSTGELKYILEPFTILVPWQAKSDLGKQIIAKIQTLASDEIIRLVSANPSNALVRLIISENAEQKEKSISLRLQKAVALFDVQPTKTSEGSDVDYSLLRSEDLALVDTEYRFYGTFLDKAGLPSQVSTDTLTPDNNLQGCKHLFYLFQGLANQANHLEINSKNELVKYVNRCLVRAVFDREKMSSQLSLKDYPQYNTKFAIQRFANGCPETGVRVFILRQLGKVIQRLAERPETLSRIPKSAAYSGAQIQQNLQPAFTLTVQTRQGKSKKSQKVVRHSPIFRPDTMFGLCKREAQDMVRYRTIFPAQILDLEGKKIIPELKIRQQRIESLEQVRSISYANFVLIRRALLSRAKTLSVLTGKTLQDIKKISSEATTPADILSKLSLKVDQAGSPDLQGIEQLQLVPSITIAGLCTARDEE